VPARFAGPGERAERLWDGVWDGAWAGLKGDCNSLAVTVTPKSSSCGLKFISQSSSTKGVEGGGTFRISRLKVSIVS